MNSECCFCWHQRTGDSCPRSTTAHRERGKLSSKLPEKLEKQNQHLKRPSAGSQAKPKGPVEKKKSVCMGVRGPTSSILGSSEKSSKQRRHPPDSVQSMTDLETCQNTYQGNSFSDSPPSTLSLLDLHHKPCSRVPPTGNQEDSAQSSRNKRVANEEAKSALSKALSQAESKIETQDEEGSEGLVDVAPKCTQAFVQDMFFQQDSEDWSIPTEIDPESIPRNRLLISKSFAQNSVSQHGYSIQSSGRPENQLESEALRCSPESELWNLPMNTPRVQSSTFIVASHLVRSKEPDDCEARSIRPPHPTHRDRS